MLQIKELWNIHSIVIITQDKKKRYQHNSLIAWYLLVDDVLILRNSSLKFKTVVDNAILQNNAVSSENISERIKNKTENGFHLKRNVCEFRRNKSRPGK